MGSVCRKTPTGLGTRVATFQGKRDRYLVAHPLGELAKTRVAAMNVVVLSYCNSLASHVIGSIQRRHPIAGILKIEWQPPHLPLSRRERWREGRVAFVQQMMAARVAKWQHARALHRIEGLLGEQMLPLPPTPVFPVGSRELHTPATLALLASLQADVLLVTHAPLLKPALFELPTLATVNIHWGIAPRYRGENTLFWPLYFRDYEEIGVTVHRIDRGVDSGAILAQGYPAIAPDDDETSITARCAEIAASLVGDVLAAAEAGDPLKGGYRPETSRLFLKRHRKAGHDLRYWARRKLLRERLESLPARRRYFITPPSLMPAPAASAGELSSPHAMHGPILEPVVLP